LESGVVKVKRALIGMLAETSIHPGAESNTGVVDLPVAREAATGYPLIPGSSMKGTLRTTAKELLGNAETEQIFGKIDNAGQVAITDARLLLLPIRSLTGHYRWVTCPYLIQRLQRDLALAGISVNLDVETPADNQAFTATNGVLHLEELMLQGKARPELIESLACLIKPLILHKFVAEELVHQLTIVSNDRMKYFASYCLPVRARNVLNKKTKTSENLWYEESLPPDTLLYTLLLHRPDIKGDLSKPLSIFTETPYLQVGGNETMGQGWCAISVYEEGGK